MLKSITIAAAITFTAAFASGATIDRVIPAVGSGPGASSSVWQSDVTLHNVSIKPIHVVMTLHTANGAVRSESADLAPRSTVNLDDVVFKTFGVAAGTGAITIDVDDALHGKLVVTSLTINRSPLGDYGQDVPALDNTSALRGGDLGVLPGPSSAIDSRFNFGLFAAEEATIEWRLLRSDGTVAATTERSYDGGVHVQYNRGVESLFEADPSDSDVVHANVKSGVVWIYGSIVNQMTGDPSYVPGSRSRDNFAPELLGLDLDRDGTVDLFDADRDGVLDTTIDVATANFPSFFRIVAADPEGDAVSFEILTETGATLVDEQGTVLFSPSGSFKGTVGALVVRASDGRDHTDFTIPVRYR